MLGDAQASGPGGAAPRVAIACSGAGHVARGFERFATELFENLRGCLPVTLYKGSGPCSDGERRVACLRRTSAVGRVLERALAPRTAYDVEAASFALRLYPSLRRERHEVAFVTDFRVARVLGALRRLLPPRAPFAIALHAGASYRPERLREFDLVHQPTQPAQERSIREGLSNTRLVPLPVDTRRFRPDASDPRLREQLGVAAGVPLIVCAAAHEPAKRIDVLIEAVASVAPRDGAAPVLLVAGEEGRHSQALRSLAAARLGRRAVLARFAPERMPALYCAADLFVLPSQAEGFALALVEAMACGLPVVTQDDATRRWIVEDAGVLVRCDAPAPLASALQRLLGDREERLRLGRAARERVARAFSWPVLLPSYVALMHTARDAAPAPARARAPL